jgi:hypothetical protein
MARGDDKKNLVRGERPVPKSLVVCRKSAPMESFRPADVQGAG